MKLTALTFFVFAADLVYCTPLAYYWREYNGTIPSDAVHAEKDDDPNRSYIGQALIEQAIVPCTIFEGSKSVDIYYYGLVKVTKNIKILCSTELSSLRWFPANFDHINLLLKYGNLVTGGYELKSKSVLKIGRVYYGRKTYVGKVVLQWNTQRLYFITVDGKWAHSDSYEALTWFDKQL